MTYWYWSTSSASESLDALARTLPSVVTDTLKVSRARITATLSWAERRNPLCPPTAVTNH